MTTCDQLRARIAELELELLLVTQQRDVAMEESARAWERAERLRDQLTDLDDAGAI